MALAGAPAADLLVLVASTGMASLAQVEGGVVVQSQPAEAVGRIQGAVSTSRYLGMSGGAALALILAVTLRGNWEMLVVSLAIGGLILLGASALGPGTGSEAGMANAAANSPLAEIPD